MKDMSKLPGRIAHPLYPGEYGDARNGAALLRSRGKPLRPVLKVLFSDGEGWDHVSVSLVEIPRCPTWEEMCYVKDLFFDENEEAIQFHPPRNEYVNRHRYCLHLWRWQGPRDPSLRPPMNLIG